jgi:hypothetical protein
MPGGDAEGVFHVFGLRDDGLGGIFFAVGRIANAVFRYDGVSEFSANHKGLADPQPDLEKAFGRDSASYNRLIYIFIQKIFQHNAFKDFFAQRI